MTVCTLVCYHHCNWMWCVCREHQCISARMCFIAPRDPWWGTRLLIIAVFSHSYLKKKNISTQFISKVLRFRRFRFVIYKTIIISTKLLCVALRQVNVNKLDDGWTEKRLPIDLFNSLDWQWLQLSHLKECFQ